jgi:lipoate-protein ligase A
MTQIIVNEHSKQGKLLLKFIESLPENVVSIQKSEEDLSDCISIEQFKDLLKAEVKKNFTKKKHSKK